MDGRIIIVSLTYQAGIWGGILMRIVTMGGAYGTCVLYICIYKERICFSLSPLRERVEDTYWTVLWCNLTGTPRSLISSVDSDLVFSEFFGGINI